METKTKLLSSALGVWAMAFLAVTIGSASLILGKRLGALFRVRGRGWFGGGAPTGALVGDLREFVRV